MTYLLFALITLVAMAFDHWLDGNDLGRGDAFAFTFMALFPIMNVLCLVVSIFRIISKLTPEILLKGRK